MKQIIKNFKDFKDNKLIKESRINVEIPIPNDIKEIANAYTKAGKDIFLVGGCIRDFLLGKKPKDWDLVTNALPEESKSILKGFRVSDEQGKNFGVLRVYTDQEPEGYEVASYRKDISLGRDTKGDDQKVELGSHVTIEDDCRRRDITINSLFYDIKRKEIVDLVGGIEDIKNNIVRAVGDPQKRFQEDRLRICRVFRFASRLGADIDEKTKLAIKSDNRLRNINEKENVSQERIWEEFLKAWEQSKDFNFYLDLLTKFNMWEEMFPGVKINTNKINSKDFIIVLTNLYLGNSTDNLERTMVQTHKIESNLAKKVVFLLNFLNFNPNEVFDFYKKKVQSNIDSDTISKWIKSMGLTDKWMVKFLDYAPSVSATDLMENGFKGAALGQEIKKLEAEIFQKN
jgi:tRNA nucleotidyltransferase/poly(A) polymerase